MTLREFRESIGLTQAQAAEEAGISYVEWYRLETGIRKGSPRTWAAIRIAFGLSPEQIGDMYFRRENPIRRLKSRKRG